MSNPFFNYDGNLIPGQQARAEAVANEFISVQTGFALLVTQGVDSGVAANSYVVTTQGQPTVVYADGSSVEFKPNFTNTGASSINVNVIGSVQILRFNGAALLPGDLVANVWSTLTYNTAFNAFTIVGPGQNVVIAGSISLAAPTHKVGLVASGGIATQAAPIDATYAIDQSIAPTWTGVHTFSATPVMNAGLTVTGAAITSSAGLTVGAGAVAFQSGAAVSGAAITSSAGLTISAGTVALQSGAAVSGAALTASAGITVSAGTTAVQALTATSGVIGAPTGGNQGTGTINATGVFVNGVAVLAGTGFVSSITGTANQIAASASTGAVTLSLPQNVIIPTPASGIALTATGVASGTAARFTDAATYGLNITHSAAGTGPQINADSGNTLRFAIGGVEAMTIGSAGNVVLAAPSSGSALAVNGIANSYTLQVNGSSTSGQSFGLLIEAGTTSGDQALAVLSQAAAPLFRVFGDGGSVVGNPTGGDQGTGTLNATGLFINGVAVGTGVATTGSFSAGTTGLSGATIAASWTKVGNAVVLDLAVPSGTTSNATTFTITGMPVAIQPTTTKYISVGITGLNNSGIVLNVTAQVSGSVITLLLTGNSAGWTASGSKTIGDLTHGATLVWGLS